MNKKKEIFLNEELRCGGFYELCIQVCPSSNMEPIKKYTDYIKSLSNIEGPFNEDFELVNTNIENFVHQWILNINKYSIPFKTYNIHENNPIETGFNWFDVSFYTSTIEKVFEIKNQNWTENPKCPELLNEFLRKIMYDLNDIYKFKLAMIDFEISGEYYLSDLTTDFKNWTNSKFFINSRETHLILEKNIKYIEIIN